MFSDAGGHTGVDAEPREPQARRTGASSDGFARPVAGGQRRRDLERQREDRPVPRHDRGDDPVWLGYDVVEHRRRPRVRPRPRACPPSRRSTGTTRRRSATPAVPRGPAGPSRATAARPSSAAAAVDPLGEQPQQRPPSQRVGELGDRHASGRDRRIDLRRAGELMRADGIGRDGIEVGALAAGGHFQPCAVDEQSTVGNDRARLLPGHGHGTRTARTPRRTSSARHCSLSAKRNVEMPMAAAGGRFSAKSSTNATSAAGRSSRASNLW